MMTNNATGDIASLEEKWQTMSAVDKFLKPKSKKPTMQVSIDERLFPT